MLLYHGLLDEQLVTPHS